MSTPRRRFWSNVLAVAYKEAAVLRHDRAFLAVVFVQPIMMMTLFGMALSNKPENVPWVVLDRNVTATSRRLASSKMIVSAFSTAAGVSYSCCSPSAGSAAESWA